MTFSTNADKQVHTGGISATTTAALDTASGTARRNKAGSTLRSKVGTFAESDGYGSPASNAAIAGIHIIEKNDNAASARIDHDCVTAGVKLHRFGHDLIECIADCGRQPVLEFLHDSAQQRPTRRGCGLEQRRDPTFAWHLAVKDMLDQKQ